MSCVCVNENIGDYSCAIQKDILVHGRMYVSSNFVCFHANIIVYETRFVLRWKDVKAISEWSKIIKNEHKFNL